MADWGWNGRVELAKEARSPLSLTYCAFIPSSRGEPSPGLEGQSIAIRFWTTLYPFP